MIPRAICAGCPKRSNQSGASPISLATCRCCKPCSRHCAGGWQVTVAVHAARQIIGSSARAAAELVYGLAVDIGSTTIAAHLCDLSSGEVVASAGVMNPQIRFGEDLMSRVSYSMMNPGGAALMTAAVREALCGLAADVARQAGISHEDILEATLVGNPIMHHLLLGIDPVELGGAPFALATDHSLTLRANVIDFKLNRNARVYVLPCIAGHVGADAAGMVLAERPDLEEQMTLLVDVGTNAEIVLGNSRRLLACSSPTGPAFEGAQISPRSACGTFCDRTGADRLGDPRTPVQGDRFRRWSETIPAFAAATAATGITGCLRIPASSRSSPRCILRESSTRTEFWMGGCPCARRESWRTAGLSRTCCTKALSR